LLEPDGSTTPQAHPCDELSTGPIVYYQVTQIAHHGEAVNRLEEDDPDFFEKVDRRGRAIHPGLRCQSYTDGSEARVVLLSNDEGANGFTTLAEWIDAKMLILELEDRVLLLLEHEDRVLTIPVQNIKNIEFAPKASKLVH
jgi:hypothetical protein